MKYKLIIDQNTEETITITAHKKSDLIISIENLLNEYKESIIAYLNNEIIPLEINSIHCFFIKDNKVYAKDETNTYNIRNRIYQLEEILNDNFIKINQSCIINIKHIKKFIVSFDGALKVILKNNYEDYISRRETKNVKRRIGIWTNM